MTTIIIFSLLIFLFGYFANMFYITVLYHRGLAHGAVELNKFSFFIVKHTGAWVTGIDPLSWTCMHRMHHEYSDQKQDPHSPVHYGVLGVAWGQLKSYERVLIGLLKGKKEYTVVVEDLGMKVNALNRMGLWYAPYLLHIAISALIVYASGSYLIGIAYYLGIMGHPIQGWLVNALAHKYGYRNFEIDDNSKNNWFVALLTCGEGYQNNHHACPGSAKFSSRKFEFDMGYIMCKLADVMHIVRINRSGLITN